MVKTIFNNHSHHNGYFSLYYSYFLHNLFRLYSNSSEDKNL
jgi:hypothetical protein